MKKFLFGFTLALCLSAGFPDSAAAREFGGPEGFRFSLDVPAGWLVQDTDFGVLISNAAKDTSLTVYVAPTTYTDPKTLADDFAAELGYDAPALKNKDEESWLISGTIKGAPAATLVRLDEGKMTVITRTGKDMAGLQKILDTFEEK